jgi:hypothetical protein
MEAAATPEVPNSNPEGFRGGSPKRKIKLRLVLGLVVIVLGLIGFVGFIAWRDSIPRSVSVTFLGYANTDMSGFGGGHRWAWFRITNRSRLALSYLEGGVANVEHSGNWIQETNFLGDQYRNNMSIEPGKSETVTLIAPESGIRWRNSFFLTPDKLPPWKIKLMTFMVRHLGRPGRRIADWILNHPQPRSYVVTSETLKL